MVTLITEKLQNQSLDDLTHKAYEAGPTLKNSKSLCSLDCEDDNEDEVQAKTVVSSPCDSQAPMGSSTPGFSPRVPGPCPISSWASREPMASTGEGGSSGDPSDWDSAGEEGIFPLDRGDLDLEQIENN